MKEEEQKEEAAPGTFAQLLRDTKYKIHVSDLAGQLTGYSIDPCTGGSWGGFPVKDLYLCCRCDPGPDQGMCGGNQSI